MIRYICDEILAENELSNDNIPQFSSKIQIQFRNLWIFLVLTVLTATSDGMVWPKGYISNYRLVAYFVVWLNCLIQVAKCSPPLLISSEEKVLEADLMSNSTLASVIFTEEVYSFYFQDHQKDSLRTISFL